jgi:hypothetical protein
MPGLPTEALNGSFTDEQDAPRDDDLGNRVEERIRTPDVTASGGFLFAIQMHFNSKECIMSSSNRKT